MRAVLGILALLVIVFVGLLLRDSGRVRGAGVDAQVADGADDTSKPALDVTEVGTRAETPHDPGSGPMLDVDRSARIADVAGAST